jgi:hypothetical protein
MTESGEECACACVCVYRVCVFLFSLLFFALSVSLFSLFNARDLERRPAERLENGRRHTLSLPTTVRRHGQDQAPVQAGDDLFGRGRDGDEAGGRAGPLGELGAGRWERVERDCVCFLRSASESRPVSPSRTSATAASAAAWMSGASSVADRPADRSTSLKPPTTIVVVFFFLFFRFYGTEQWALSFSALLGSLLTAKNWPRRRL